MKGLGVFGWNHVLMLTLLFFTLNIWSNFCIRLGYTDSNTMLIGVLYERRPVQGGNPPTHKDIGVEWPLGRIPLPPKWNNSSHMDIDG